MARTAVDHPTGLSVSCIEHANHPRHIINMTTAHRPTFDPVSHPPRPSGIAQTNPSSQARGKEALRGPAYHQRLLPAHTQLKFRKAGQGGDADDEPERDLAAELLAAEAAHFAKKNGGALPPPAGDDDDDESVSATAAGKRALPSGRNGDGGGDDDDEEDLAAKRRRILEETREIDADDSSEEDDDDDSDDSDDDDEDAELQRELERVRREREEKKKREVRLLPSAVSDDWHITTCPTRC